jgi:hypothetical protein
MTATPFIITIDAEGDNLWAGPREITTRNAEYLPRFQALCERYRFKPVYLANYEMVMSDFFVEFARDVAARNAGEIGMHLHAWNSPPLVPLTDDDIRYHPYLIEYPEPVMREKIRTLTRLLQDRIGREVVSHRAGRWAFDGRYAAMLLDDGYRVDCSVTPSVDWRRNPGVPGGRGGSDYTGFPDRPYFLNPADISRPGVSPLLEVPMTTRVSDLYRAVPCAYGLPLLRQTMHRVSPKLRWLCPSQLLEKNNLKAMLRVADAVREDGPAHLEFMLHSSELMPGGSPEFPGPSHIERLYEYLEMLFENLSSWCRGMTLMELHAHMISGERPA